MALEGRARASARTRSARAIGPHRQLERPRRAARVRRRAPNTCGSRWSFPLPAASRGPDAASETSESPAGCGARARSSAIPPILDRTQPVAVLDVRLPTGEVAEPRPELVVDAGVMAQNVAAPAVVIAGDHRRPERRRRRRRRAPRAARNPRRGMTVFHSNQNSNRSPLMTSEPPCVGDVAEERDDGALDVCRCEPEMRVGNDVAGRGEHARILPMLASLYKHERSRRSSPRDQRIAWR